MSERKWHVAVVGATGAVGREMVAVLEERQFPVNALSLFASERSRGMTLNFCGEEVAVQVLQDEALAAADIALFSAGAEVSRTHAPRAAKRGVVVVDNSSAFRLDAAVPLIVPEVNGELLHDVVRGLAPRHGMVISNPNCSTIQLVVVLKPLLDRAGIRRVVVSTYQAVSGAGQKGIDELSQQVRNLFGGRSAEVKHFPHQIAFNCLAQIDVFQPNGYTREEMKIVNESRKILALPDLRITATAVRVPVFACHSEAVNVETEQALSPDEAREVLRGSPGVIVLDDPSAQEYPQGFELAGTDATYVGRIRQDESVDHGLNMWVVADNLRKGAALNAVQIAEIVTAERTVH